MFFTNKLHGLVKESVNSKFAMFHNKNCCTRPDTVFHPLIQLQQGGGFPSISISRIKAAPPTGIIQSLIIQQFSCGQGSNQVLPLASHGYVSVSYLPIPRFCICIISTTTAIKELFTFKLVFGVQKSYKQLGSWSDTFISLLLRADITQFFSCSIHSEKHCNLPNRVAACFGPHCTALHCYTKKEIG